ncbi:MAG: hypothetical protein U0X93_17505 [Anaerolineales bacterium]
MPGCLFSHVYEQGGFNERDYLVAYLNEIGEKRREILKSGTSVICISTI